MSEAIIAIICDFDETLGIDSTSFFLSQNNIAENTFWPQTYAMVKDGWDPPLAYMQQLLELEKSGKIDLSQKNLRNIGKKLPLFEGLPEAFLELKKYVKKEKLLKKANVKLEFYIISGGIEDIILGSDIGNYIDGIFCSRFAYDTSGKPIGIKTAISFTEKTRYLFGIHKGVSVAELRNNPYKINKAIPQVERRIPFSQIIYIGDGPSDIPCMSTISHYGGTGIGVVAPQQTFKKGYELAIGKRITVGPYTANYKAGSDMRKILEEMILRMSLEIAENKSKHIISASKSG